MARRVLVTGATSGIGEATVRRLLEAGWTVYATARDPADLDALEAAGGRPVELDLADEASIEAAAREVGVDEALDGLVHNAGIGIPGAVEDLPPEAWRDQFQVNVFGPVELTRRLAGPLREAGGRLVFVSSQAAIASVPLYGAYSASKAALESAAAALRAEMRVAGVRVSLVQPGPVETPFQDRSRALLERHVDVDASPHRASYEGVDRAVLEAAPRSTVDDVAQAVERALTARWPPARIPVGRMSWLGVRLAQLLPTALRDRVFRWSIGLEPSEPEEQGRQDSE